MRWATRSNTSYCGSLHGVSPVPGVSEPVTSREEVEAFIDRPSGGAQACRPGGGGRASACVARLPTSVIYGCGCLGAHFVEHFVEVARRTLNANRVTLENHVISTRVMIAASQSSWSGSGSRCTSRARERSWRAPPALFEHVDYVGVGTVGPCWSRTATFPRGPSPRQVEAPGLPKG